MFDELLTPLPSVDHPTPEVIALIPEVVALKPADSTGSPSSTTVDQDAPSPSNSQITPETQSPVITNHVEEDNHDLNAAHMNNDPFFSILIPENDSEASSSSDSIPTVVQTAAPNSEHVNKWTKDHLLDNIIGELEKPVSTQLQLYEQALFSLFDRLLGEIRAFSQHENESLTDAWLRMKEMLRNCHGHNLSKGNIIKIFYHGLNGITQEVLSAAAGGIFLYKTPNQAYQLLKDKVLLKLDWAKNKKTKSSLKKTVAFADEGNSNSDTDKIMARMDAMTIKMDAQYKELQSRTKKLTPDLDDDDIAKFMQTFHKTRFYNDYRDRDSNFDNWLSSGRIDLQRDNYDLNR
ncbi:hypothetical protein Tco_1541849 [Tanacetum coccineum]